MKGVSTVGQRSARRIASSLLDFAVQRAHPEVLDWAHAMRAELPSAESGWDALRWALGAAAVLVFCNVRAVFKNVRAKEGHMGTTIGKNAFDVAAGFVLAVASGVMFGQIARQVIYAASGWRTGYANGVQPYAIVACGELVCILAIVGLWRQRRCMAIGVGLFAVTELAFATFTFAVLGR